MPTAIWWNRPENGAMVVTVLDAAIKLVFKHGSTVTKHPVESGANISDHMELNPDGVEISGVFSNHPLEPFASLRNESDRAAKLYWELQDLRAAKLPATIITSLRFFENMVLTQCDVERNAQVGASIPVTLSFEEIRIAQSETTDAPEPKVARAKAHKSQGRKAAKPAKSQSMLKVGKDVVVKILGA